MLHRGFKAKIGHRAMAGAWSLYGIPPLCEMEVYS